MLKCRFRFGRYVSALTSVYLWAALASIVFPFFMLLSINSEMSLGHTRNLQIPSISEGVDTRKFLEDMCQEAEKNSIAIARRTLDVSDTRHGIVLEFCGAENTVRGWEQTGYPSYTPEDRVEVKRLNPARLQKREVSTTFMAVVSNNAPSYSLPCVKMVRIQRNTMFSISEVLQGTTWEPQAGMPLLQHA